MNSFKNFSKLTFATLITASLFMACSEEISETTADTPYTANTGNIRSAGSAVDLGLPSGTKWADMNVGASSASDNGILFVWGDATGTQIMPTTSTSYDDVKDAASPEALFNLYKSEEKVGYLYDTLNVYKETTLPLLSPADFTNLDATIQGIFDKVKDDKSGKLLATITNGSEVLCYCQLPLNPEGAYYRSNNPKYWDAESESWKEFEIDPSEGLSFVIDNIDSTEVKYFENTVKNDYDDIKNAFDQVMHKDYKGSDFGVSVYNIIADGQHDPATANWGSDWKMPTAAQMKELVEKCEWEFTGTGYKVTGPNGNSIFLPAAGYRYGDKVFGNGTAGYYASGEISGSYHFPTMVEQKDGSKGVVNNAKTMPSVLIFQNGQFAKSVNVYDNLTTSYGFAVRPVAK